MKNKLPKDIEEEYQLLEESAIWICDEVQKELSKISNPEMITKGERVKLEFLYKKLDFEIKLFDNFYEKYKNYL
jgi:GTP-dependent phosphoenolpyruvate carboxykinase